jgi:hypothetical protein
MLLSPNHLKFESKFSLYKKIYCSSTGHALDLLSESYQFKSDKPLKAYMVVNFRTRGISRGKCKLTQTPTLIKKTKKKHLINSMMPDFLELTHL